MRALQLILVLCLMSSLTGCAIMQVKVRNPVPGLQTVAIAPFFNLSTERSVNGREFANAYYAELQKVPGFEVIPIGVVETALREHRLEMGGPEDAIRLAEILKVDAVVVGAVTDYDPYVPRVGLKIAWYSPKHWEFLPLEPPSKSKVKILGKSGPTTRYQASSGSARPSGTMVSKGTTRPATRSSAVVRAQSPDNNGLWTAVDESYWQPIPQPGEEQATIVPSQDGFLPPLTYQMEAAEPENFVWRAIDEAPFTPPYLGERLVPPAPATTIVEGPLFFTQEPTIAPPRLSHILPVGGSLPLPLPPEPIEAFREPFTLELKSRITDSNADPSDPLRVIEILEGSEDTAEFADAAPVPEPALVDKPEDARPATPIARGEPGILVDESPKTNGDVPPPLVPPHGSDAFFEQPFTIRAPLSTTSSEYDPMLPLMSYIQLFDASDAELIARLSDYLEVSGEIRNGDVQAFMRRTDFFQKFTAHVMVTDMLAENGGEARRRWVFKQRTYR